MRKFDAITPLGGGRFKDGTLTPLSCERLDEAAKFWANDAAPFVFALGGNKSTYRQNAIEFEKSGGWLRRDYLTEKGVSGGSIITLEVGCQDTIGEASAVREFLQEKDWKRILIVTSSLHLPRAVFLFKRIHGEKFKFFGHGVPSERILIAEEEKEYLDLVKRYFAHLPKQIPEKNFDEWYISHRDYYEKHLAIHDKYHSGGRESQAYLAVKS